jgi:hypothetical protein
VVRSHLGTSLTTLEPALWGNVHLAADDGLDACLLG